MAKGSETVERAWRTDGSERRTAAIPEGSLEPVELDPIGMHRGPAEGGWEVAATGEAFLAVKGRGRVWIESGAMARDRE